MFQAVLSHCPGCLKFSLFHSEVHSRPTWMSAIPANLGAPHNIASLTLTSSQDTFQITAQYENLPGSYGKWVFKIAKGPAGPN